MMCKMEMGQMGRWADEVSDQHAGHERGGTSAGSISPSASSFAYASEGVIEAIEAIEGTTERPREEKATASSQGYRGGPFSWRAVGGANEGRRLAAGGARGVDSLLR